IYRNNLYYCYSETPIKINGNISGADLMIVKQVFDELGGFDENFFMYYEETDLLFRLRKRKYQTFIVPESKIIHLEGASETIKETRLNWTYESKEKYYLKNKSKLSLTISNMIFYLTVLQRLVLFKVLRNKGKYDYWMSFYNWLHSK
ncbi:glycosyltransferase family 2 protein, partial [Acinetobacter baumannii]|nr:glycosyltransferase family 2 protein [Acinetobacter baumannii]